MDGMKSNRKFKQEDEAVSAVIGVILMVAITVAIAATVYVYVSGMIGTSPQQTPNMQLVKDDTNNKLTVASADPGNLLWSDFALTNTTGSAWNNNTGTVEAGQIIEVSSGSVTVSIRHVPTNTLIGTWEFN